MEFGALLDDAFSYTKEGIFGNMNRWFSLILAVICLGIPMNGYVMRIYRGTSSAPEADQWGTLFIDGLKLMIVGLIYAIPMMIVWAFIYGGMLLAVFRGSVDSAAMASWSPNTGLLLLLYAIEIVIGIFMPVAAIRFARTGSFSEAFNFGEILRTIKNIGWITYLIALIILTLVIGIPVVILILGFIIVSGAALFLLGGGAVALLAAIALLVMLILIISPLFAVFQARYLTRVYESSERAE
jgi:hypothetical protein